MKWIKILLLFIIIPLGLLCGCRQETLSGEGVQNAPAFIDPSSNLPGLVVEIIKIQGATGIQNPNQATTVVGTVLNPTPKRNFLMGDRITMTFTVKNKAGQLLRLEDMDIAETVVAGPTTNYHRILPFITSRGILEGLQDVNKTENDLWAIDDKKFLRNPDGSYTFRFSQNIPNQYAAPMNDSPKFSEDEFTDNNFSGAQISTPTPLKNGTYSIGLSVSKKYIVGGVTYLDSGNVVEHFIIGDQPLSLDYREVVKDENCNQCHVQLMFHNQRFRTVQMCLLCHTVGAEDRDSTTQTVLEGNDPTPYTVEFGVLMHKLHNGAHLPSFLGVSTNADGTRNYNATPQNYILRHNELLFTHIDNDLNKFKFGDMPSQLQPMPRDQGYSSLSAANKLKEDTIRSGVVNCDKCHGDPDGAGPLTAPAHGKDAFTHFSLRNCGSCHDDLNYARPYISNGLHMPAQTDSTSCTNCHSELGNFLTVKGAHIHPLKDPKINPGLNFNITGFTGGSGTGGNFLSGDEMTVTFTIKNDSGADLNPSNLEMIELVINGPTINRNMILHETIPKNALPSAVSYAIKVPKRVFYELIGTSTTSATDSFTTATTTHWTGPTGIDASTALLVRTGTSGGSTSLSKDAKVGENYIDVGDVSGFAKDEFIVLEDGIGGKEEYLKIGYIDSTKKRIWFSSSYILPPSESGSRIKASLTIDHSSGALVKEVQVTSKTEGTHYSVVPGSGTVTEIGDSWGNGNKVIFTYSTNFKFPSKFPPPMNSSPDLGEPSGKWQGKSIIDGTYTLGIWGSTKISVTPYGSGETTDYYFASKASIHNFLFGMATQVVTNDIVSSPENCNRCHTDLTSHQGTRRGYTACVMCHGTAGIEDRPVYISGDSTKSTPGVTVDFRYMMHKLHLGRDGKNPSNYKIIGSQNKEYSYQDIRFPPMPGRFYAIPPKPFTYRYKFTTEPDTDPNLNDGIKHCETCHGNGSSSWYQPGARTHPLEQNQPIKVWKNACTSCHENDVSLVIGGKLVTNHFDAMVDQNGVESCGACHSAGKTSDGIIKHKVYSLIK